MRVLLFFEMTERKTTAKRARKRRPPSQERSRETYNKLLDAAEKLLKQQPWEKISTVAIMAEAGCSNGAIYGRFKSKDDLLVGLYERHDGKLKERFRKGREEREGEGKVSFDEFLDRELGGLIDDLYENRWLLREMGLLSRIRPEVVSEAVRSERKKILDQIAEELLEFRDLFDHPEPKRAAQMVVFLVATTLRESILYQGPHFGTLGMGRPELKETVKRLAKTYLGVRA